MGGPCERGRWALPAALGTDPQPVRDHVGPGKEASGTRVVRSAPQGPAFLGALTPCTSNCGTGHFTTLGLSFPPSKKG